MTTVGPVMKQKNRWFDHLQGVVLIVTCGALLYSGFRSRAQSDGNETLPSAPISLLDAPLKGNPQAKVAIIFYSDYECPFCSRFVKETWPAIAAKYVDNGSVLVAYRHLPLEKIHKNATRAATAANCAGDLGGRFWEMNDLLYMDGKLELNRTGFLGGLIP